MAIRIDGTNTTANPGITGADADTGLQFGTDEVQFVTGGTNRATVESNGNLTIEDGNLVVASGHGIDFSATVNASGSTQELLDDYEEGTWTPYLEGNTTAGAFTYGDQTGVYVKVGKKITITCNFSDINISTASAGSLVVKGIPYTSASGSGGKFSSGTLEYQNIDLHASTRSLSTLILNNASQVYLRETRDSISVQNTTSSQFVPANGNVNIVFALTYFTS